MNMGTIRWPMAFVVCLALAVREVVPSQEIMQKLTAGFVRVFEQCKNDLNLGEKVMLDFYNFWRQDYELVNRDLGCVVLCMASKLDMIDKDMKLHHNNAQDFAKSHGADAEVAKQLVTILHDCETLHLEVTDHCSRVLEIAKCFRNRIVGLNWTPSMEVVFEEIMTFE